MDPTAVWARLKVGRPEKAVATDSSGTRVRRTRNVRAMGAG
jgi:hypothetical protein